MSSVGFLGAMDRPAEVGWRSEESRSDLELPGWDEFTSGPRPFLRPPGAAARGDARAAGRGGGGRGRGVDLITVRRVWVSDEPSGS